MNNNPYSKIASKYKDSEIESKVLGATPYELISILFEEAQKSVNMVIRSIDEKNYVLKGKQIERSLNIVSALQSSLNHENGGDVAKNLDSFYGCILYLITQANIKNDTSLLVTVNKLIKEIADAWQAIKPAQ